MTEEEQKSTRDGVGRGLLALGEKNPAVVVLSADLKESTRAEAFAERYPQRFVEMGVAEQNMAGVAAGLALGQKIPFVLSYSVFSPGLNWGIIRSAIAYSNLPVKLIGGHSGLATGADGATHQALEDLALMRTLPNLTVLAPADEAEAYQMTLAAAEQPGPVYIRTSKLPVSSLAQTHDFTVGQATVVHAGDDACIIAHGTMVSQALAAAQLLSKQSIACRVINCSSIKPLDEKAILSAFRETHAVVSVEDHQVAGGLGSTIAELVAQQTVRSAFKILGVQDSFGESGSAEELYEKHGLTAQQIANHTRKLIEHHS